MKNRIAWAWLLATLALPAAAQDEAAPATDAAPAADEAPAAADTPPAEAITENAVVIDDGSGNAPSSDASTDSSADAGSGDSAAAAVTGGDSGGAAADEETQSVDLSAGLKLYVGLEYDQTTIDINDDATEAALGRHRFSSDFYKLRLGWRVFDGVGVEFHAGFPANKPSSDELETKQFYGLYLVPTGVLLDTVEVSVRLGYAYTELKADGGKDDADGASFGVAFELPLRHFGEGMPNLRLGAGGTVYQEDREGRIFGWHGGIRYDFTL